MSKRRGGSGRSEDTGLESLSRYISFLLRHHPEAAGILLDEHGWADVDALIEGVNRTRRLDRRTLERIVATDTKGRYAFSEDGTLIRANQGHSIPVDVELAEVEPPARLYHGTDERFCASIEREGLRRMSRLYVHLSGDVETAVQVGKRHGRPVVYAVDCAAMRADGYRFYRSVNGVWLTEAVPPKYLIERLQPQGKGV